MPRALPWLLFAHLLADYPLQGTYLAETKGTNSHSLLAHAGIWTGCMVLGAQATGRTVRPADGLLLLVIHAGLDLAKARRWGPYARLSPPVGLDGGPGRARAPAARAPGAVERTGLMLALLPWPAFIILILALVVILIVVWRSDC